MTSPRKEVSSCILSWIRFTNERHSTTIGTIGLPRVARSMFTLIGSCRIYSIFQIKAGRFRKRYRSCNRFANENLSPRLFSNIAQNMQVESSCKLVWLLQNCFLLSISRTWKTIEVLSFSRTVNQLIMRVHKPKVEYKLALQERPKGENLDVLL